ncbi:queuosine 5'-phosphate N-glycosylase/hydrolase-like [Bolinopsis microptera]|uniref:queuosine 5'-phosphate N-glycosylase/hydrolase-like n=1 Tax=Bolinopsis microptera TaxID=2820187 RepID=UPI00307A3026
MTTSNFLNPQSTGLYVNTQAKHIKFNKSGADKVAEIIYKAIVNDGFGNNMWQTSDLNPRDQSEQEMINWIFFVDTANFSFWPDEGDVKFGVKDHKGKLQTGQMSLCAAVNRALREGIPVTDAKFMANATMEQFQMIFRSDTDGKMTLLGERLKAINEAGKVLLDKFSGSFSFCVMRAEKDVQRLIHIITDNFESYRDMCQYEDKTVSFLKRAQLLVADVWKCLGGKGLGEFSNIRSISMLADYRVPQSLVAFDVLHYDDELKNLLKSKIPIIPGDYVESEIRGMSIYAVEKVLEQIEELARDDGRRNIEVNAVVVDYFLWGWARNNRVLVDVLPFHRCRTIYY